jgi:DNA-binding CsgD family transcriptional regulator/tetratricopeptide (TPR) repeat protein
MARRLSSPVFIGRSYELDALLSMAEAAASGQPTLAIVGGEAGVGKSRLVAEVARRLQEDHGWLVLEGGSVALGDDSFPFGPIVEALRALARSVDPEDVIAAAGPSLPELARLVPELVGVDDGSHPQFVQAEGLQIRIFEGVLRLLGRLGETAPILLIVEDLHWSDRSTRDLLSFLIRNIQRERVLVVATLRTDEVPWQRPITAWLAETERQSGVERIDLSRFERGELVELLTAIIGSVPLRSRADPIVRRSDGNAFFAEELLAAGDDTRRGRDGLPDTIRGVLIVRLSALSDAAKHLVEIAAVAGRQVGHDVLAEVCGMSQVEMSLALHEAVDAQLLVVDVREPIERYAFRHALAQEAAYDELLPSERRALHAAYARVMETRPSAGDVAEASRLVELAHHWTAANDSTRAFTAAIAAGDASFAVFFTAEALHQYERAIQLWDVVPADAHPRDRDLADLYDVASNAARLLGDGSRAVALARREIELLENASEPDSERRARALERLSRATARTGDFATAIPLAEEAIALYGRDPQSPGRARVLSLLAASLMLAGRFDESVPFAERAIEAARTIGHAIYESRALSVLGADLADLGNIAGGIELLRHSLTIMSSIDDPSAIEQSYGNLAHVLGTGGFIEESLETALAGANRVQRYTDDLRFTRFLECNAAEMLTELGRYSAAADLLAPHVANVLPGVYEPILDVTMARLAIRTGDLAAARRHLEIAWSAPQATVDQYLIYFYVLATEIALWDRDPATALEVAREGFDRFAELEFVFLLGQLAIPATQAAADLAVRARAARDLTGAEDAVGSARHVIERYRASTSRLTMPDALATHEIGWRMALCTAELARATGDDDPATWDAMRPAIAARPAPFLEAYILWRKAEAVAERGETAAAAPPLRDAYAVGVAIGAPLLVDRFETLGRALRINLSPPAVDPTQAARSAPLARAIPFGLSKREREVLPLVAKGYTNRRIAEILFISESTAGVHISNILRKLGVESRTEAAAVAVRLGLDRTP